jgi:hypothetical protein
MSDSRYLIFVRTQPPGRKTPIVQVCSRSSGNLLGVVAWFGPWRQFCFRPERQTVFNVECMTDIQAKIAELKAER